MEELKSVCIAALAFKRPSTLRRLLRSFKNLYLPTGASVHFLIVDNDPEGSAWSIVKESPLAKIGHSIHYVIEKTPGIPAARNRALQEAKLIGSDLLCFTDDDAWVDANWLLALLRCREITGAHLILGPQRIISNKAPDRLSKRFVVKALIARSRYIEKYAVKKKARGQVLMGGTYNWMVDLNWILSNGIVFDESYAATGGEDTAFRIDLTSRGGRVAWCERAIVYEEIENSRLSLRYQFRRYRTYGANAARTNRNLRPLLINYPLGSIISGCGLILLPIVGLASFMLGLQLIGMGVGMLDVKKGRKLSRYTVNE